MSKQAIIIGAGPAGLTAAYELLKRTDIIPIVLEKSGDIGGISKTVNYKGNRIDIGGHRFFSKSDRVMNWWCSILPVQADGHNTLNISYQNKSRKIYTSSTKVANSEENDPDKVMLVRKRLSRIYFLRKFFTYPIQLSFDTLSKLGLWTTIAIMASYLKAQLFPRKPERSLQDFMINRFGATLYKLFFKDYTEKVWGVPCEKIPAEWGAQRIKGVSISKAIQHAIQSAVKQKKGANDIAQKDTETSLIEQFLYPKYGPGQLWEEVARQVQLMGGKILMCHDVKHIYTAGNSVTAVATMNQKTGETSYLEGDYFFSTMPVQELIGGMDGPIPDDVKHVASGLQYRDFITVGILLKRMSFQDKITGEWKPLHLDDTWIYIQEKDVKVGRLQVFNNWSPFMVKDPETVWVGMEFFCNEADDFWQMPDSTIQDLATRELEKLGLACQGNVLDTTVLRMEKTYPAYFGTYNKFHVIREFVDKFENLFLVGRNGMHKYNNSDHSMLTAMVAVDNICAGVTKKENIWAVNTEQEYHEEKPTIVGRKVRLPEEALDSEPSFYDFIFRNRRNRAVLWIAAACLIVQFIVFKILFPYANFMPDSYSYIEAAYVNSDVNTWPVGYSKFLRVFSAFLHSDTALVLFQYLFLEAAIIYFIFTLLYFIKPRRIIGYISLAFFILNPMLLYMSNYVSADAIFTTLSLLWLSQLLWILFRPQPWHIFLQAGLLVLVFMTRYNALYYPIITTVVLIESRLRWKQKFAGIALSFILISMFVWHSSNKYQELTGKRQFSGFGGWQLASNALYMYSRMPDYRETAPSRFADLHKVVQNHLDSLRHLRKRPDSIPGIYYLWSGPLTQYLDSKYQKDTSTSEFKRWASVAPLYAEYGFYLIKKHPIDFFQNYLLPNTINYYAPPIEFLGQYNMKSDSVGSLAKTWFGYRSERIKAYVKEIKAFKVFTPLNTIISLSFLIGLIGFISFNGLSEANREQRRSVLLITLLWLANVVFSILASPIVMRYQIFLIVVNFPFVLLFFDYLIKVYRNEASKNRHKTEISNL